jgi:hypothetical protein
MSYAEHTLITVNEQLGIQLVRGDLFVNVVEVEPSAWLRQTLTMAEHVPLGNEKTRSEFLVAPILLECQQLSGDRLTILSGERLDVDPQRGLVGVCDFILGLGPKLPIVQAPLAILLEAKRGIIEDGLGQCAAQMLGARIFNERKEGRKGAPVFGCVTSGELWQFLRLDADVLSIDTKLYHLPQLGRILAIFKAMLASWGVGAAAA